ncbi:hypothetical protein CDAR_26311 [Caerostris darwini]|uniref:Uncharacterized protein n=1 Tax=Caerostris darwini TaxID=1538125 RepID=A0AAV4PTI4_9ARAC|nr:hypothetical protein CDAR_26311 [Caerostris darwini]
MVRCMGHPRPQPNKQPLELTNQPTQLRRTTALLKTAVEDIARAEKFRAELDHNNDVHTDQGLNKRLKT